MSTVNLPRASTTACIDENTIGALFDHRLAKGEVEAIDQHVADCSECRELLSGMARLYVSSSPSRALVQTASIPLASAASGAVSASAPTMSVDGGNIQRLLALLGCERQVGRVLGGKWRLDAVIGVGGMAEVYAATHLSNGRRAAIKMLRREWLARPNVVYRFLREGSVANRINHPGAVAILDDGTADDGMPFLVLELLDGRTIGPHVRDPLPIANVLWIACEILGVLSAAHAQEIVHRDIKPENVFLTRDGSIKVLDFGIARMHELAGVSSSPDGGATQQGTMMGTPAYMPPEQARGERDAIDARTDVWAVGATIFALLAGRPVHARGTPNATLAAAMTQPAPRLATVAPTVQPEICAIVDRALAFSRDDRWPSARAMQEALESCLVRLGAPHGKGLFESWPEAAVEVRSEAVGPEPSRHGRLLRRFAGLVAIAVSVTGVFFVARSAGAGDLLHLFTRAQAATNVAVAPPLAPATAAASPPSSAAATSATVEPRENAGSSVMSLPDGARAPADPRNVRPATRPKAPHRAPARRADVVTGPAPMVEEAVVPAPAPAPPPAPVEHPLDRRD